jgi:hypothetical protein
MPALSAGLRRLGVAEDVLAPWSHLPVTGGGATVGAIRVGAALQL